MRTGRITVPLDVSEAAVLWEMAEADCRTPHDQIRFLLRRDAQERGLLKGVTQTTQDDRNEDASGKRAA